MFDEGWTFADNISTIDHPDPMDQTGPAGPFEGAYYLYYETSGPAIVGATGAIQTPPIFLEDFRPELSFYLFMYGSDVDVLNINVITSSGKTTLQTFSGQRQSSKSDPWKPVQIDLGSYRNQTVQIEFEAMKDGGNLGDIAIDLVEVCTSSNPIPTMSEWGIILLGLSMLIIGVVAMKESTLILLKSLN